MNEPVAQQMPLTTQPSLLLPAWCAIAPLSYPPARSCAHWTGSSRDRLAGGMYPRGESALTDLGRQGISVLINLHKRPQDPEVLARHGLTEVHLPVADFTPPTPEQLHEGVADRRCTDRRSAGAGALWRWPWTYRHAALVLLGAPRPQPRRSNLAGSEQAPRIGRNAGSRGGRQVVLTTKHHIRPARGVTGVPLTEARVHPLTDTRCDSPPCPPATQRANSQPLR